MKDRLTEKQRRFAAGLAAGKTQADAYTGAGYSDRQARRGIERNAYKLAHTGKILDEIARLQALADEGAILSREQRLALLTSFALNTDGETGRKDRLRALDMIAKMNGDYSETIRADVSAAIEGERSAAVDEMIRRLAGE